MLVYPVDPQPRWRQGHPALGALISTGADRYAEHTAAFGRYVDQLLTIPRDPAGTAPGWDNKWFTGLDAISLYGFIADRKPATYLEVGSGNSSMFARRAIESNGLRTRIVSIDPQPREDINDICDEVIREPVQDVDLAAIVADLRPGDVVFVDNSHQSFMNSDVTVCVLDLLPVVPSGVLVGYHDTFLPFDYPESWREWWLNEQYLLGAFLLGGHASYSIEYPCYWVARRTDQVESLRESWSDQETVEFLPTREPFWIERASSFWLQRS